MNDPIRTRIRNLEGRFYSAILTGMIIGYYTIDDTSLVIFGSLCAFIITMLGLAVYEEVLVKRENDGR